MERCFSTPIPIRTVYLGLCIVLLGLAAGCGRGEPADSLAAGEGSPTSTASPATPEQAVHELLTAFKHGDDAKAAELVTLKARQEADRTGQAISPPGSKTMEFKIGGVEYVTEAKDGAHVACQITDVDPEGEQSVYDVIWFLRKESPGWRIAGIAMKVFEDELPVLYNFEDQDDMERKRRLVEEEMVRRAKQTLTQAQQPPADGTRKQ